MISWLRRVCIQVKHLLELNLQLYASNASFFLLISAFPAAMLLVTLLRFLPLEAADMLETSRLLLPSATQELAAYLIEDLYSGDTVAVISVTAVTALWSASRGVLALLGGINAAYGVQETRSWLHRRLICLVYTMGLLLFLVATLALLAFGQYIQQLLERVLTAQAAEIVMLLMPLRTVIMAVCLIIFFAVIYVVFPNRRRLRFWQQLPGAVLAAGGWVGFSTAYSFYLERFGGNSYLYGSLTAVVVTMLWLYFCVCIVFFGAALNADLLRRGIYEKKYTAENVIK